MLRKRFAGSLPTRERGLKYSIEGGFGKGENVAPYTGAWIEILSHSIILPIELVAPYTGAWIEILHHIKNETAYAGRSLHGSVD